MSLKPIAVVGLTLAHGAGSVITGGVFTVISVPSVTVAAGGRKTYENEVKFMFSGGSAPGFKTGTIATETPQTIPTSAIKCRPCTLEGDFVLMAAVGAVGNSTAAISGKVEISNAGQSVARAI